MSDSKVNIIEERQAIYGHPIPRLTAVEQISEILAGLILKDMLLPGQAHALTMIVDKLTRAAVSPAHADSWVDIAGYAEIGLLAITEANKQ